MFEGDLDNGELEIGQVSSLIQAVKPAAEVMTELVEGYSALTRGMEDPRFRWPPPRNRPPFPPLPGCLPN